ncbi:MAG: hypothetical protein ACI8XW_001808, partial [Gammaproteobacteria bacterium]
GKSNYFLTPSVACWPKAEAQVTTTSVSFGETDAWNQNFRGRKRPKTDP